ncbi:MAG: hypothetical protein ACRDK4_01715 [Solirubrobacteraceae bacterium]
MRSLVAVLVKVVLVGTAAVCGLFPGAAGAEGAAGVGAMPGAVLAPVGVGAIVRPYERSGLRLVSRLTDGAGRAVGGADVEVLQKVVGEARWEEVGAVVTRPDGVVVAVVPPGPSRLVDLAYGPLIGGGFGAQAEVFETVDAGLSMRASTGRTGPEGAVTLEGRVFGRVPAGGVVVEVLVYYQGVWEPIRTPRSDRLGRVRVAYRFHRAFGRFPFRLRVRRGQAGFPYGDGLSRWVEVDT